MILKFITPKGHEAELTVAKLISVDGQSYQPGDLAEAIDTNERIARLEAAVDVLLQLFRGDEEWQHPPEQSDTESASVSEPLGEPTR